LDEGESPYLARIVAQNMLPFFSEALISTRYLNFAGPFLEHSLGWGTFFPSIKTKELLAETRPLEDQH
jgi:hypothetical protein